MIANQSRRERGQTLVVVALMMGVLLLMAGLAVDVGMAYNERRDLQNAADAAALAGAQQLCDNRGTDAANAAAVSMGQANGAITVTNQITTTQAARRFAVTVQAPSPTFFFRLVGIRSVPVSARAAAECSCAASLGGAWPIAFDMIQWNDAGCMRADGTIERGPNQLSPHMMIWEGHNQEFLAQDDMCALCDCSALAPILGPNPAISAWGGNPMLPGDRGWVRLTSPPGFQGTPWGGVNNCGTDALNTWVELGYPGQIPVGSCVATKSGRTSAIGRAEDAFNRGLRDTSVVIYHPNPPNPQCRAEDVVGDCRGGHRWLRVVETGCIRLRAVYTGDLPITGIGGGVCNLPTGDDPRRDMRVAGVGILATKMCDCVFTGGGVPGGPTATTCVEAVGLVE